MNVPPRSPILPATGASSKARATPRDPTGWQQSRFFDETGVTDKAQAVTRWAAPALRGSSPSWIGLRHVNKVEVRLAVPLGDEHEAAAVGVPGGVVVTAGVAGDVH